MKSFEELKNKHKGEDIWLVSAGSSMDFIESSFFENKIVLGQNNVYKKYKCDYVVMKDCMEEPRFPRAIRELEELDIPLIYTKHYAGHYKLQENVVSYKNSYMCNHSDNDKRIDGALEVIGTDVMACVRSTITTMMNIAAYMGAKNIMSCGVDCGTINNNLYYDGYTEKDWKSAGNWGGVSGWISSTHDDNIQVRNKITEIYGCNIYSLNPFMNFQLDGNEYKPC